MNTSKASSRSRNHGVHLMVGFNGLTVERELRNIIRDFEIGGIVLFRRNVESPAQVSHLLAEAQDLARSHLGRPLLVAVDQEGGPVQRFTPPFTQLPSARELSLKGPEAVARWAAVAAAEMKETGVHINFAPVLDLVPQSSDHFMRERTLGDSPEEVSSLGRTWIQALQTHGVSATGKHYPGLGSAESDPHHFAPVIHWEDFQEKDRHLAPFQSAIEGGVHGLMTSHAKYPLLDREWPATLSPRINKEMLRHRLGFQGVLFSDDMDMAALCSHYSWDEMVCQGLEASIDFFLACQRSENIGPLHDALARAISESSALKTMHRESLERIALLRKFHFPLV